ncbi:MAG: hypothetical protein GXZ11_01225 [Tissierellia bacterium]|nr:hypothetical protein [Tissierellia bacterium]
MSFRKKVLDLLVNSVTVWDDPDGYKNTVVYNIKSDNTHTYNSSDIPISGTPIATNTNLLIIRTVFVHTFKHLLG